MNFYNSIITPIFLQKNINSQKRTTFFVKTHNLSSINKEIERFVDIHDINKFLLFGIPEIKDVKETYKKNNIVSLAVQKLRENFGKRIEIFSDMTLSPYTKDGHSVIIRRKRIDHKKTRDVLCRMALSHAEAGVDFVAPLGIRDYVKVIRETLDNNGYKNVKIMSYSAKFSSSLYGPYREVIGSPMMFKKKAYQLKIYDVGNALRNAKRDASYGADIIIVKPALPYLDIIAKIKQKLNVAIAAYHVSGEYCMIKAASEKGWIDERNTIEEIFTSIKRAGADFIITYIDPRLLK